MDNMGKRLLDENIYDGVGLISSELLKEKFEGFKSNRIVVLKDGFMCKANLFSFNINESMLNGGKDERL